MSVFLNVPASDPGGPVSLSHTDTLTVAVVLERRDLPHGRWISQRWQVLGIVLNDQRQPPVSEIRRDETSEQTLWRGFRLQLHRDDAESYYYNLLSDRPRVFVVCRQDETDGRVSPVLTLLSHYEAEGYAEVGDQVHPVDMPPEVHRWVERFVVENYQPEVKKSRKREGWHD